MVLRHNLHVQVCCGRKKKHAVTLTARPNNHIPDSELPRKECLTQHKRSRRSGRATSESILGRGLGHVRNKKTTTNPNAQGSSRLDEEAQTLAVRHKNYSAL